MRRLAGWAMFAGVSGFCGWIIGAGTGYRVGFNEGWDAHKAKVRR